MKTTRRSKDKDIKTPMPRGNPRIRLSITIDSEILDWVVAEVKEKNFGSLSHAFEFAIKQLMNESKKG